MKKSRREYAYLLTQKTSLKGVEELGGNCKF